MSDKKVPRPPHTPLLPLITGPYDLTIPSVVSVLGFIYNKSVKTKLGKSPQNSSMNFRTRAESDFKITKTRKLWYFDDKIKLQKSISFHSY